MVVLLHCRKENQEAVHHALSTKILSTLTEVKPTADYLSWLEPRAKNARVESSNLSMAKLLLQDRSFIRCRKERQGETYCKHAKKNNEN